MAGLWQGGRSPPRSSPVPSASSASRLFSPLHSPNPRASGGNPASRSRQGMSLVALCSSHFRLRASFKAALANELMDPSAATTADSARSCGKTSRSCAARSGEQEGE